jgi:signal transduction histidine kinase
MKIYQGILTPGASTGSSDSFQQAVVARSTRKASAAKGMGLMRLHMQALERHVPAILPVSAGSLAAAIFAVDTITDLEIAVAVFYIVVVLMSVSFCRARGVVLISAGCMTLTIVSYFLTKTGEPRAGLINCVVSLAAIGVGTYVVLRIKSVEVAIHEARAQLAHVARVRTMGELAASIAHEINQPLSAIVTNAQASLRLLSACPPNEEEARQALGEIVQDANRASEIVTRVRGLAKKAPPKKELLSLNEAIADIVALARAEILQNRVHLRTELQDYLPSVVGDRIQLQQVMLNLLVNAIEAMSEFDDDRARELTVRSAVHDSTSLVVSVADTGKGVDPGTVGHLFDLFQTTKPEGLGVGLAISRSIIEDHGGRIWVTPNTPRGAIFQFTLPISLPSA